MKWIIRLFLMSCVSIVYAQDFRKEWSDFQGYDGSVIPSAIYTGEVSDATNVILENDVIETSLGISSVATPVNNSGAVYGFVPYQNNSKSTLIYWFSNFGSWQEMNTSNATSYLAHTEGNASVSGTAVTGTDTNWLTHVVAGDDWKCAADADSAYININSVNSNTSLTLASAYSGGCSSAAAYRIRKTFATSSDRPYYTGSMLNGWALLLTGDDTAQMYDGTSLYTNVSIGSAAVVTTHKNRWFTANIRNSADNVYWGPVNSTATWDSTAFEPVFSQDGSGGIVGIVSDNTSLIIFKRFGKIYRMFGEFDTAVGRPTAILQVPTPPTLGQIAPKSIIRYNNVVWFITTSGLYSLRDNEVKLMGRNFQDEINSACITNLYCDPNDQQQVFSGVFEDRLYLNLDTVVGVIDSGGKASLKGSLGDTFFGGFANFNLNFYGSNETSNNRILRLEVPDSFNYYDNSGPSTVSVNMSYISESYCGDLSENQKEFRDFYILYEQDGASNTVNTNQIRFDASIDDGNYLNASTITTNGQAGMIASSFYRVGSKGNCIKWRLRENSLGRRNRVVKVVLRGKTLELR